MTTELHLPSDTHRKFPAGNTGVPVSDVPEEACETRAHRAECDGTPSMT